MPKRELHRLISTIFHKAYRIATRSRKESNGRKKTEINAGRSCATKLNKEHKIVTAQQH